MLRHYSRRIKSSFDPQHPRGSSHPSVSPASGGSDAHAHHCGHGTGGAQVYALRQDTHNHKTKGNKSKQEGSRRSFLLFCFESLSLLSSGWPQTHYSPTLAFRVLGVQSRATVSLQNTLEEKLPVKISGFLVGAGEAAYLRLTPHHVGSSTCGVAQGPFT